MKDVVCKNNLGAKLENLNSISLEELFLFFFKYENGIQVALWNTFT